MQDLFTQALGINSPWFIKDVSFDNKQLNIHIDYLSAMLKYFSGDSIEAIAHILLFLDLGITTSEQPFNSNFSLNTNISPQVLKSVLSCKGKEG
jgi:DNA relaxase NicK